jgi:hypothetical protein
LSTWQLIDQTTPVDTRVAPFNGERVMLWLHPDAHFGEPVFGSYVMTSMWGACWRFEDEHTIEAPAGALFWMPAPTPPTLD